MTGALIIKLMIYSGSVLMLFSIMLYVRFARYTRETWGLRTESATLWLPIVLLVLFLAGYLAVATFGKPDLIIGSILLGGSLFVYLILRFIRTLAERVEQVEQLRVDLQAAEKANASKTIFLSNMSHDIRTPLNAIIGYSDLAAREGVSEADLRSYVRKIGASGRQLLDLINDILEMSRIESGRMELEEKPEDIAAILETASDIFAEQMKSKRISFSVDTSGVRTRSVMCDRVRLSRAIINLISNAYKFTPAGGTVEVKLVQSGTSAGAHPANSGDDAGGGNIARYILTVRDTGIGMSPEFASRVFESFERERTSIVSGIQGTGLGMAITKSIVGMMGGDISLETEQGRGTKFTVILEFREADEALLPAREDLPPQSDCDCSCNKRILLAEDVDVNREIAVLQLESMGLCVETAVNGREAVQKLCSAGAGYYDAVLMDIQMPVMNGYEAAEAIRALEDPDLASIPIVALTANAFEEDRLKAIEAGMNDHVAKPLDPARLRSVLKKLLMPSD